MNDDRGGKKRMLVWCRKEVCALSRGEMTCQEVLSHESTRATCYTRQLNVSFFYEVGLWLIRSYLSRLLLDWFLVGGLAYLA
jgi:hypothetical protein